MGAIQGMLGMGGGASGTGYNVNDPVTQQQVNNAASGTNNALTNQQQFLAATQAQNGLGNQTQNYNQLQGIVNGTGPNPAQAMLAQATGANTANQAALMAGQRGASQNVGLIARQAAQQGAANQQQAAGQGATLQANQSLNALGQAGTMANTMAAQQAAATSANTNANIANQGQLLGAQQGYNQAQAGLAQTTMGQQSNLISGIAGGVGSALGLAEGGEVPRYDAGGAVGAVATQSTVPDATSGPTSGVGKFFKGMSGSSNNSTTKPQPNMGNLIGQGLVKGAQALFSSSKAAPTKQPTVTSQDVANPTTQEYNNTPGGGAQDVTNQTKMAEGGKVPALVSPGERYLPPSEVKKVEKGEKSPMKAGEKIPGKPKVGGAKNSYANDTVPKTLEEGGIVLPRSVTQAKNPHWAAHAFVQQLMAQKGKTLPTKGKK